MQKNLYQLIAQQIDDSPVQLHEKLEGINFRKEKVLSQVETEGGLDEHLAKLKTVN